VCSFKSTNAAELSKENPAAYVCDLEREERGIHDVYWLCDPRHTTCHVFSDFGSNSKLAL
jgi:hypothetical protein